MIATGLAATSPVVAQEKESATATSTLGLAAPAEAVVLFDGSNLDAWKPFSFLHVNPKDDQKEVQWKIVDGEAMEITFEFEGRKRKQFLCTKQRFGDYRLHLEFQLPEDGGKGNSGLFFGPLYEMQILDSSKKEKPGVSDCGAIYQIRVPDENAALPPGQWQTVDLEYKAARFRANGYMTENNAARVTIRLNGVLIHDNYKLSLRRNKYAAFKEEPLSPIVLQEHGSPVKFRNIWLVEKNAKAKAETETKTKSKSKPATKPNVKSSPELSGATAEIYKKASGSDLHIYRFDPEAHDPKTDKRPAVVFFFGGGWNGGKVEQFAFQSRYLASRGLVTFVADYRVKSRQKVSPNACVEDGKSAVRWIRQNADRLGIDPDKIIAGGGSAGGHVAAAAGICDGFENEKEELSISSKPNALLLFNPVYDNRADGEGGYGYDRIKTWFPAISPAHNITADDPPAIVFLGSKDKLISVATAETFRDKMIEQMIQSELHVYDGQPHGFFNLPKAGFSDTLAKTDQFLVKLGYLSGPVDQEKIETLKENAAQAKKKNQTAKKKNKDKQ